MELKWSCKFLWVMTCNRDRWDGCGRMSHNMGMGTRCGRVGYHGRIFGALIFFSDHGLLVHAFHPLQHHGLEFFQGFLQRGIMAFLSVV